MNFHLLKSLKVKILVLTSLFIAVTFAINWNLAVNTIEKEKKEDLKNILAHVLVESVDEYMVFNLTLSSDVTYLQTIPHNVMILKNSEVHNLHFTLTQTPAQFSDDVIGVSTRTHDYYLNISSDTKKIDQAVSKYANQLFEQYFITLLIFLGTSWFFLQRYLTPLSKLANQISAWKDDDPFAFSVKNVGSEIQELSFAFSNLIKRLDGFRKKEKELFKEMAHELKTPLAIMKARIDVYENDDTADKKKFISDFNNDIARLTSELKSILFFESSDFDQKTKFYVDEILTQVIAKTEILAHSRGLHLFVCADNFEVFISKKLFKKVLIVLIENALTYAKENSEIKIDVGANEKRVSITNVKNKEKFLFSSKIGHKILNRITQEINIKFEIFENDEIYCVNIFLDKQQGKS